MEYDDTEVLSSAELPTVGGAKPLGDSVKYIPNADVLERRAPRLREAQDVPVAKIAICSLAPGSWFAISITALSASRTSRNVSSSIFRFRRYRGSLARERGRMFTIFPSLVHTNVGSMAQSRSRVSETVPGPTFALKVLNGGAGPEIVAPSGYSTETANPASPESKAMPSTML